MGTDVAGLQSEPAATALLLTTFGVLLGLSVLFSRAASRLTVPIPLVFLAIGMLAGSEGIGGIVFEDYRFAFRIGAVALVLILFDGGLNTPLASVRRTGKPAAVLATLGVVGTAALLAASARALGFPWLHALLLGAIVSSTDAAAVFAVLRSGGIQLKRRVGGTLEVESGLNDPMAVILTMAVTRELIEPGTTEWWRVAIGILMQLAIGAGLGLAVGYGGRKLLSRLRLPAGGIYAALTLALAFLAFGLPTIFYGSGFLAVYVAAVVLGNGPLPLRPGLLRVHDALAWLSQIAMFLVLGLLVFPSRLMEVWWWGLLLALFLALVARPLVVGICLLPFRYPLRDVAYVGWVGLRGAVPIVLATIPVLAGAPGSERVFDIVFFIVVVTALLPGATVPWVTRRLGLESDDPPPPRAVLEIASTYPMEGELLSFYVDDALAVCDASIDELPLPESSAVTMIVRGRRMIPPRAGTRLESGDHAYVFVAARDREIVQLMFGRPESE